MHAAVLPTDFSSHQEYFAAALAANARLIRRGISGFRADPVSERFVKAVSLTWCSSSVEHVGGAPRLIPCVCKPLAQHGTLDAMAEHHHMVHMHKLKLLANFVVKGSEEKCGSTSSMTRFPMSAVSVRARPGLEMHRGWQRCGDLFAVTHLIAGGLWRGRAAARAVCHLPLVRLVERPAARHALFTCKGGF